MNKTKPKKQEFKVNDELHYSDDAKVRIVGNNIESAIISFSQAKKLADEKELDLFEINTSSDIPILRVDDYNKYIFDLNKKMKSSKSTVKPIKEIDLRVNITLHDLETKAKQIKGFIEKGLKVKIVLTMKGRELTRRTESQKRLFELLSMLENFVVVETLPKEEGNKTVVVVKHK